MKKILLLILAIGLSYNGRSQNVTVSGPKKKWDKIAITLTLPGAALQETAATFKDRRMDVVFTRPNGTTFRVPGFFAADGNAANTSAAAGRQFKAYLRPDATGQWSYRVLYYSGNNVAIVNVNQLPTPQYTLNGSVGNIQQNTVSAPDLRAKGRLRYQTTGTNNQRRYLKFQENGEYYLKVGPDSPESLLDYNEFDFVGGRNACNRPNKCTIHVYPNHAQNYNAGTDPFWKTNPALPNSNNANKKGKNIIGALNYISSRGMNSISMSLYGGDAVNIYPWRRLSEKLIYDVSKLEQWEIVLQHAESKGLFMHFKLSEMENSITLNQDQDRLYYREMVARFGHHLALEWNIGEEFAGNNQAAIKKINWLVSIDPWKSPRVIHTSPSAAGYDRYRALLAANANLTGASVQSEDTNDYRALYNGSGGILRLINDSKNAGRPWVVASDEQAPGNLGLFATNDFSNPQVNPFARTRVLWKILMAGGQGVMWYGGGAGDFRTEDFRRFDILFNWSNIAVNGFFKNKNVPFWNMENRDNLVSRPNANCLAQIGKSYVIYLEGGGSTNLNLTGQTGTFRVQWFNPRSGGNLSNGSVTTINGQGNRSIGNPPNTINSDWVALVTVTTGVAPAPTPTPTPNPAPTTCNSNVFEETNGLLVIEAESAADYAQKGFILENGAVNGSQPLGAGFLRFDGFFTVPANPASTLTYKIKINTPGRYRFLWRNVRDPKATAGDQGNDSWLYIKGAGSRFFGIKDDVEYNLVQATKVWVQNSDFVYRANGETNNGNGSGVHVNNLSVWAQFNSAGEYTIEFGGRSKGHSVDRLVLFQSNRQAAAVSLTTNESSKVNCTPTPTTPAPAPTPPTTGNQRPFSGTPGILPGKIQAEDYDFGGQGVSYNDTTPANIGGVYRNNHGVDIEPTGDATGAFNVAYMATGEWLEYTVNSSTTQSYDFFARVASITNQGRFKIQLDGQDITNVTTVPNTGAWQTYISVFMPKITVTAGTHIVRFQVIQGGFNLNNWAAFPENNAKTSLDTFLNVKVFPSPLGTNDLTIQIGSDVADALYTIHDISGKLLKSGSFSGNKKVIPSDFMSQGIYILRIQADGSQFVHRVVK